MTVTPTAEFVRIAREDARNGTTTMFDPPSGPDFEAYTEAYEKEKAALARFKKFIDDAIDAHFVEATIVKRLIKTLKAAGNPIVKVDDREEATDVKSKRDILEQVFNLDECFLITKSGGYIFFVMGNEWDCIADYNVGLEADIQPVLTFIDRHMR